jgi:holo-[acyl-carrier protein] synthase
MIFVGTDLVEVDRIRGMIEEWSDRFLRRIFTPDEIAFCQQRATPSIHFAGRFAAKEAVKKAVYAAGRKEPLIFRDIHIQRDPAGAPIVVLVGMKENPQVSISHTSRYAVATAVLEIP